MPTLRHGLILLALAGWRCVAGDAEIHKVLAGGQADEARKLIQSDPACVRARGANDRTPLHLAVTKGQKDIAKLLIDKGADVNAADEGGETPLHLAALYGSKDLVKLLIAAKATVDATAKFGGTPLHRAAVMGRAEAATLLLAAKADVDFRDGAGRTPLDRALEATPGVNDKSAVIDVLKKAGGRRGQEIPAKNNTIRDSIGHSGAEF